MDVYVYVHVHFSISKQGRISYRMRKISQKCLTDIESVFR